MPLEDTVLDDSVLEACQVLHYDVNEAGYQACEDSNEGTDNPALDLHCPESLDRGGKHGALKGGHCSWHLLCWQIHGLLPHTVQSSAFSPNLLITASSQCFTDD